MKLLETDVLVVGCGAAGASAAIEGNEAGSDVIVVEAAGGPGGASAMAGGLIYLGGGTALQRALGFDDDVDNMTRFLTAALGPGADEAKIEAYCRDSPAHFDWLVDRGVPFRESFWDNPTYEPWDDSGLMYCGGERAHPFADIARPVPRGHCPQAVGTSRLGAGGGFKLLESLLARVAQLGIRIEVNASARAFEVDAEGRVVGVVARQLGEDVRVKARHGVVLTSGGFGFDEAMVAEHAPVLAETEPMGIDQHDGSMMRAAVEVGAALRNMNAAEAAVPVPPGVVYPGLVVDRFGRRFINEDSYMGRIGQAILHQHEKRAWAIFDSDAYDAAEQWRGSFVPDAVCETPAELAEELGLPAAALDKTIADYNADASLGIDSEFNKASSWVRPLRGAIGAAACGPLRTFTLGGLVTDVDGRVRHEDGSAIPGLYAAGRVASGLPAWGYVSGSSLGDCTYFGRRAGRAAAESSEPM